MNSAIPVTTPTIEGTPGLLDFDRDTCLGNIGASEFPLRHRLARHPLLSFDNLAALADALPPGAVENHDALQPLLVPGGCTDLEGRPSEIVHTMEHNRRWMVLWNIEQVAPYDRLLDEVLEEVAEQLPPREGRMGRREAFLFISAANAVTPVHFDPENNFLLQIRGTKEISVGRFPHRDWEMRELDRYHNDGHRNLEQVPPVSAVFRMQPGDGVYLYPWAPHWVQNGREVSVSLSITFRTRRSEREELAHIFNARLRRLGMTPRSAGESRWLDIAKAGLLGSVRWVRRGGRPQLGARAYQ